jgi:transcriptional regulator with XRE-family HTH domain
MPKTDVLPLAVQNLRKIWDNKKSEMQFTQTEAAKELGWSQGAISHYLNNLTELGSGAVVKLANFLGVDPLEIDPTLTSKLPNVTAINVAYHSEDMSKKLKETVYIRGDIDSFYVEIAPGTRIASEGYAGEATGTDTRKNLRTFARLCDPTLYSRNTLCAVRLKGDKKITYFAKKDIPDRSQINKHWAVISFLSI